MDCSRMVLALASLALSGCTALETRESQAWLVLHAIDTAQTLDIAHDSRCYEERDGITRSLIGAHPSDGEVIAWSVGMAGLHLGVTELLLRNDHPKLAKAWQYVRIGITLDAISNNYSAGIRIGSANDHRSGSCIEHPSPAPVPVTPRPIG